MSLTDHGPEALAFRAASVADASAIVMLVQSAYRGEASRAGWTTEADLIDGQRTDVEAVMSLIRASANCILLGERNNELLVSSHLEQRGAVCHFGMFAVRPGLQGGGLGQAMLAEAERLAQAEWGCAEMQMTVITQRTELIAWYERRGYRRTGVFRPFPYGETRYGIPKRDDLRLEVLHKWLRKSS